jgi:very-short-patch-repair endonuclease
MAAVLACGRGAYLSHDSAALLWRILALPRHWQGPAPPSPIHVSLLADVVRRVPGIRVHRRPGLPAEDLTTHNGIPITSPTRTLIDLATILPPNQLEAAVNEADVQNLIDPESVRAALDHHKGERGVKPLRTLLDRHTYRMTQTELERRFLRIVRKAGLPLPETQQQIGGRVDFHWPALNLVVETDGWRYHRTPARQARDNRRMQAHLLAGRTAIRVGHYEIRYEEGRVVDLLAALVLRQEAA